MQTIEYRTHDKTTWADGPWQSEPDKKQWLDQETGLPCLIVRGRLGALCGYVGVPKGHWAHGKVYDDVNVDDVHGGLTFAGGCSHGPENIGICHKVEPGEPDDAWWLGFDCGHYLDFYPGCSEGFRRYQGEEYRDLPYVTQECMKLARQLKEVA